MAKEGEQLEKYLRNKGLSAYDLAENLSISAQNVYYHLKRDKISLIFKERLARAGYNLFNLPIQPDVKNNAAGDAARNVKSFDIEIENLKREIEYLKQLLAAKDEVIKVKDEVIAAFREGLRK
jgi:DNA-binding transcriptional ArsR family regulator